jgi:cell division inhibitor SepF
MDILSTVKRALGVSHLDEHEEDYHDEYDTNEDDDRSSFVRGRFDSHARSQAGEKSSTYSKVVTMPTDKDMKVVYVIPESYDDARSVSDNLKAFAPVIVKLEKLEQSEAQRVIDFIMGACYTLDGRVQEIKEDVFLIAPSMVEIELDFDDVSTAKSGSFFSKFL